MSETPKERSERLTAEYIGNVSRHVTGQEGRPSECIGHDEVSILGRVVKLKRFNNYESYLNG